MSRQKRNAPLSLEQLLRKCRELRRELLVLRDPRDPSKILESTPRLNDVALDEFDSIKLRLVKLLAHDLLENIERLHVLRKQASEPLFDPVLARTAALAPIRQAKRNREDLADAMALLRDLQGCIVRNEKVWPREQLIYRQRAVELLRNEINAAAARNRDVNSTSSNATTSTTPKIEYGRRIRAKRNRNTRNDDKTTEVQLEEVRISVIPTAEEKAFMEAEQKERAEQDKMLDDILNGVTELHAIAKTIGQQIAVGSAIGMEMDTKIDTTHARFDRSNKAIEVMLAEASTPTSWLPPLVCVLVLFALVGYLYHLYS